MYYRLNSLTNRIAPALQMAAYQPQGLRPLAKVEQSVSYFMDYQPSRAPDLQFGKESAVSSSRSYSAAPSHGSGKYSPVPERIRALQAKFQKDDGIPVHLKGGQQDYVFYYGTVALCVVGTIWSFYEIFQMARPKKPQ